MASFAVERTPNAHVSATVDHIEDVVARTPWDELEPVLLRFNTLNNRCWDALAADNAAEYEALRDLYREDHS